MPYEWDDAKRMETLEKRGIDFASVDNFDWGGALHRRSDRGGEMRWASIGLIGDRLYHVVWTVRSGNSTNYKSAEGERRREQGI